jgi:hypothetical protein
VVAGQSSTVVEMFMTEVNRSGAEFDVQAGFGMTDYGGLDGGSRPTWYVPGSGSAAGTASPEVAALSRPNAS